MQDLQNVNGYALGIQLAVKVVIGVFHCLLILCNAAITVWCVMCVESPSPRMVNSPYTVQL